MLYVWEVTGAVPGLVPAGGATAAEASARASGNALPVLDGLRESVASASAHLPHGHQQTSRATSAITDTGRRSGCPPPWRAIRGVVHPGAAREVGPLFVRSASQATTSAAIESSTRALRDRVLRETRTMIRADAQRTAASLA